MKIKSVAILSALTMTALFLSACGSKETSNTSAVNVMANIVEEPTTEETSATEESTIEETSVIEATTEEESSSPADMQSADSSSGENLGVASTLEADEQDETKEAAYIEKSADAKPKGGLTPITEEELDELISSGKINELTDEEMDELIERLELASEEERKKQLEPSNPTPSKPSTGTAPAGATTWTDPETGETINIAPNGGPDGDYQLGQSGIDPEDVGQHYIQ